MDRLRSFAESIGGNRTVMALSIGRMGDAIGNSVLFIGLPVYLSNIPSPLVPLALSTRTGILLSLFGLTAGFLQPVMGSFIDRTRRPKPFIVGGLILLIGATISYVFATQYIHLLILRFGQGLAVAATVPATLTILTQASEKQTRGGSMGIFTSARVFGLGIGPLIGGALIDTLGFHAVFYTAAAFVLIGVILVQVMVKNVESSPPESREERPSLAELATPAFLALGSATFAMAFGFGLPTSLETQFNQRLSETALAFSIAFSALMFTRLILQVPIGHQSDRIGRRRFVIWGLVLMAVATGVMGLVTATWQLILLRVVQGVASAAIAAPTFALAGDLARGGRQGRQTSIVTMGFGFGIALGTLVAGVTAVLFLELPFIIGAVLAIISAGLVYWYVPDDRSQSGESSESEDREDESDRGQSESEDESDTSSDEERQERRAA